MPISQLLPIGALPKWLLFTALLSLFSTIQYYATSTPQLARQLYSWAPASEVTPLAARLFGTWNLLSTTVRACASYNIHDRATYALALWTYVVAVAHFSGELIVWGTVGGQSLYATEATPVVTILWMITQWRYCLTWDHETGNARIVRH